MLIRLSILCPALFSRQGQWPILESLRKQCNGTQAELIVLTDDGLISIGEKHNMLMGCTSGEYACFVADDDEVADDYVAAILDAIGTTDVVTFDVDWSEDRVHKAWNMHGNQVSSCRLKPLAPVRTSVAKQFTYPNWWQSEDRAYEAWLGRQGVTKHHIGRVLYRYRHRPSKPEYGGLMYPPQASMASNEDVENHLRAL